MLHIPIRCLPVQCRELNCQMCLCLQLLQKSLHLLPQPAHNTGPIHNRLNNRPLVSRTIRQTSTHIWRQGHPDNRPCHFCHKAPPCDLPKSQHKLTPFDSIPCPLPRYPCIRLGLDWPGGPGPNRPVWAFSYRSSLHLLNMNASIVPYEEFHNGLCAFSI